MYNHQRIRIRFFDALADISTSVDHGTASSIISIANEFAFYAGVIAEACLDEILRSSANRQLLLVTVIELICCQPETGANYIECFHNNPKFVEIIRMLQTYVPGDYTAKSMILSYLQAWQNGNSNLFTPGMLEKATKLFESRRSSPSVENGPRIIKPPVKVLRSPSAFRNHQNRNQNLSRRDDSYGRQPSREPHRKSEPRKRSKMNEINEGMREDRREDRRPTSRDRIRSSVGNHPPDSYERFERFSEEFKYRKPRNFEESLVSDSTPQDRHQKDTVNTLTKSCLGISRNQFDDLRHKSLHLMENSNLTSETANRLRRINELMTTFEEALKCNTVGSSVSTANWTELRLLLVKLRGFFESPERDSGILRGEHEAKSSFAPSFNPSVSLTVEPIPSPPDSCIFEKIPRNFQIQQEPMEYDSKPSTTTQPKIQSNVSPPESVCLTQRNTQQIYRLPADSDSFLLNILKSTGPSVSSRLNLPDATGSETALVKLSAIPLFTKANQTVYLSALSSFSVATLIGFALSAQNAEKTIAEETERLRITVQDTEEFPNKEKISKLVDILYKDLPHQCPLCGIRFEKSVAKETHIHRQHSSFQIDAPPYPGESGFVHPNLWWTSLPVVGTPVVATQRRKPQANLPEDHRFSETLCKEFETPSLIAWSYLGMASAVEKLQDETPPANSLTKQSIWRPPPKPDPSPDSDEEPATDRPIADFDQVVCSFCADRIRFSWSNSKRCFTYDDTVMMSQNSAGNWFTNDIEYSLLPSSGYDELSTVVPRQFLEYLSSSDLTSDLAEEEEEVAAAGDVRKTKVHMMDEFACHQTCWKAWRYLRNKA